MPIIKDQTINNLMPSGISAKKNKPEGYISDELMPGKLRRELMQAKVMPDKLMQVILSRTLHQYWRKHYSSFIRSYMPERDWEILKQSVVLMFRRKLLMPRNK